MSSLEWALIQYVWRTYKREMLGVPGWVSRLGIQLLISALVFISGSWDQDFHWTPHSGRSLFEILSLPLSLPLSFLSLSKINLKKGVGKPCYERDTKERSHVKTEAETGVIQAAGRGGLRIDSHHHWKLEEARRDPT